jgi:hypothetical protein
MGQSNSLARLAAPELERLVVSARKHGVPMLVERERGRRVALFCRIWEDLGRLEGRLGDGQRKRVRQSLEVEQGRIGQRFRIGRTKIGWVRAAVLGLDVELDAILIEQVEGQGLV